MGSRELRYKNEMKVTSFCPSFSPLLFFRCASWICWLLVKKPDTSKRQKTYKENKIAGHTANQGGQATLTYRTPDFTWTYIRPIEGGVTNTSSPPSLAPLQEEWPFD